VIEFHSVPCTARAELQDIELAWISQELTERFYNLLAVGEGSASGRRRRRAADLFAHRMGASLSGTTGASDRASRPWRRDRHPRAPDGSVDHRA
jgi:hypothetical protein